MLWCWYISLLLSFGVDPSKVLLLNFSNIALAKMWFKKVEISQHVIHFKPCLCRFVTLVGTLETFATIGNCIQPAMWIGDTRWYSGFMMQEGMSFGRHRKLDLWSCFFSVRRPKMKAVFLQILKLANLHVCCGSKWSAKWSVVHNWHVLGR